MLKTQKDGFHWSGSLIKITIHTTNLKKERKIVVSINIIQSFS